MTTTTGNTPTTTAPEQRLSHFHGVDLATLQASTENALSRALFEVRSPMPDWAMAIHHADIAASTAYVLKLAQGAAA